MLQGIIVANEESQEEFSKVDRIPLSSSRAKIEKTENCKSLIRIVTNTLWQYIEGNCLYYIWFKKSTTYVDYILFEDISFYGHFSRHDFHIVWHVKKFQWSVHPSFLKYSFINFLTYSVLALGVTDKSLGDTSDIISDSSGVGTANSDTTNGSLSMPGSTVVCIESYNSKEDGHLCIQEGDIIEGEVFSSNSKIILFFIISGNGTSTVANLKNMVKDIRNETPSHWMILLHNGIQFWYLSWANKV